MDPEWASVWKAKCDVRNSTGTLWIFQVSDAGGPEGITENGPRVGLSMESKMIQNVRNSKRKPMILEAIGAGGQEGVAENGLRVDPSMERKR